MLLFIIDKYRYLNGYGKHKWCSLCSTALQHCEYSKYIYVIVELQTKSIKKIRMKNIFSSRKKKMKKQTFSKNRKIENFKIFKNQNF